MQDNNSKIIGKKFVPTVAQMNSGKWPHRIGMEVHGDTKIIGSAIARQQCTPIESTLINLIGLKFIMPQGAAAETSDSGASEQHCIPTTDQSPPQHPQRRMQCTRVPCVCTNLHHTCTGSHSTGGLLPGACVIAGGWERGVLFSIFWRSHELAEYGNLAQAVGGSAAHTITFEPSTALQPACFTIRKWGLMLSISSCELPRALHQGCATIRKRGLMLSIDCHLRQAPQCIELAPAHAKATSGRTGHIPHMLVQQHAVAVPCPALRKLTPKGVPFFRFICIAAGMAAPTLVLPRLYMMVQPREEASCL